jgi:hypothetical protein
MLTVVSISWHPDPENAFWQLYGFWHDPPDGPESPGERTAAWIRSYRDAEPPGGVLGPPVTGAGATGVTGLGDPVRSFVTGRDLTPAEAAEFRRELDEAVTGGRTWIMPPVPAAHRGQCQGCGLDDDLDVWGRCAYCAELAALRERNLPGPPLSAWWWYLVPGTLALALGAALLWALLAVALYALLCRRITRPASAGKYSSNW